MTPEEAADGLDFLTDDSCSPLTLAAQGAVRVLIDHARATAEPEPEIGAEVVTGAEVAECDWCEDPATVALPDLADDEDARRPDRDPRACHKHDAEFGVGRSVPLAPEPAPPIAVGDTVTTAAELDRLPVGAVVITRYRAVHVRMDYGWSGGDVDGPVRVIDLPEATS